MTTPPDPFGDVSAWGVAVTLLYFAVAWRCRAAALVDRGRFWLGAAVVLLLFGLNKQLDVQTDIIAAGRALSRMQGWHGVRRGVEAAAMLGVALLLAAGLTLAWRAAAARHERRWALAGAVVLAAFYALRASRILHVAAAVPVPVALLHALLEPGGLLLLLWGAGCAIRRASST